jgi:hypothetical protein
MSETKYHDKNPFKINILDLLRSDGSIVINKALAHLIGLNETILLSEIISLYKFYEKVKRLDDGGFFYATHDTIEDNTTLKKDTQIRTVKKLVELGLITSELRGLPAKRHFNINEDAIAKLVIEGKDSQNAKADNDGAFDLQKSENPHYDQHSQNAKPSTLKKRNQGVAKVETSNTKSINTNIKEEEEEEYIDNEIKLSTIRISPLKKAYPRYAEVIDFEEMKHRDGNPSLHFYDFIECCDLYRMDSETVTRLWKLFKGQIEETDTYPMREALALYIQRVRRGEIRNVFGEWLATTLSSEQSRYAQLGAEGKSDYDDTVRRRERVVRYDNP